MDQNNRVERFGIAMSAARASVIDRLQQAGDQGLSRQEFGLTKNVLQSHITALRIELEATDYDIVSSKRRGTAGQFAPGRFKLVLR